MYRLGVSADFSAAHSLRGYGGACEELHGHNYRVEAVVEVGELDPIGLGVDFRRLKEILAGAVAGLDHRFLNDLPQFAEMNPSSENIARHIHEALEEGLRAIPAAPVEVKVWETPDAWAAYRK